MEDSANGVRSAVVAAGLRCVAAQNAYTRTDDLTAAVLVADDGLDDPELVTWFDDHLA